MGLELLAEAGNFAAVQRILQTSPYWAYHPAAQTVMANMDALCRSGSLPAAAAAAAAAAATLVQSPISSSNGILSPCSDAPVNSCASSVNQQCGGGGVSLLSRSLPSVLPLLPPSSSMVSLFMAHTLPPPIPNLPSCTSHSSDHNRA